MIPLRNIRRNIKKAREFPGYAIKVLYQRGRSTLSYHFGRGKSAPPETISLLLTYRCNLRCRMCGQWGESGSARYYTPEILRQELGIDEIMAVIDDVKHFSPTITLFGGEPLLYRNIIEAIEVIKGNRLRVNIVTNGTLLKDYAKELVHLGLNEIIFSLDGPPDVHDRVRGRKGIFQDALEGFMLLMEEKERTNKKRPVVNVNSTIFDFNYEDMDKTFEAARGLGAGDVTFHHLIFLNEEIYNRHNEVMGENHGVMSTDWAGFVIDNLPSIDPEGLIRSLNRVKSRGASVYPNLTDEEVRRYYKNFDFSPESYKGRCISPWMVAYIFPDGSVRPCLSLGVILGNIREKTFRDIWNSDGYQRFRRDLKLRGRFPACIRCTELYRF